MSGKHVPHGWRSSIRTIASEQVGKDGRPLFAKSWIDAIQDHLSGNQTTDAYVRRADAAGGGRVLKWWCDQLGVL
jgi:hypothetical protein